LEDATKGLQPVPEKMRLKMLVEMQIDILDGKRPSKLRLFFESAV